MREKQATHKRSRVELSYEFVSNILEYHHDSGKLYWRERSADMFPHHKSVNAWNGRYAGKEAGCQNSDGYRIVVIDEVGYLGHRLAWFLYYREWPLQQIDHINGKILDNRISNLRLVNHSQNGRNKWMNPFNRSGVNGVCWDKRLGKWRADIKIEGRQKFLGSFLNIEDAANARFAANRLYGFTDRHGEQPT